ncbi:flagellin [Parvibaculum sp.]|uniref:flagellin N-terminal helical domain-containing protein n=1 Tax=Parvibaculum sp. TaxID=2024848 RepID=UPI002D0B27AE|nr:flagellin [Parvibaculum sp.]HUD51712.1 flagellin [Parvibaculum sp.]
MADVVLSSAMRSNLLSMQATSKLLDQTQQRVATGLKVNSAVDNPQSYFTAQGLNGRASDLNTLLDNEGLAVQTINAASQGIDAIQKLVQQAKATATQALQTTIQPTTLQETVTAHNYSGAPGTLTIKVGSKSAVTISLTTNIQSAGDLKAVVSAAGIPGLTVTETPSGLLKFTVASGDKITLSGDATTSGALSDSTNTNVSSNGTSRNKLIDDYNNLLTQIDQLANDASFNGINLLKSGSTLVVNFNEDQSSKLTIAGVSSSSSGVGLSALSYDDFNDDENIKSIQNVDDSATNKLRTLATSFASSLSIVQARQDFTKNLVTTLQTGAANLITADTNEEGANLLALQTRQQLGVQALSIASQAQQSILKLF